MKESIKIIGIVDDEPFDVSTWSGSSYYFFSTLKRKKVLVNTISSKLSKTQGIIEKTKNFNTNFKKWKIKYQISTSRIQKNTKQVLKKMKLFNNEEFNTILQIGAWYYLEGYKNKLLVSYHDANIGTFVNNPYYNLPFISNREITKIFQLERKIYNRSDIIFTFSDWLKKTFIKYFEIPESKIISIGAGINIEEKYLPTSDYKKEYNNKNILFIGKEFERKGGLILLEAFKQVRMEIPDAKLIIIGPTQKIKMEGVVELGYLSKNKESDIKKLVNSYQNSSVFVLPSLYEPFGISFLEAMAFKLPCIGTNNCAMPEIIDNEINGLLVEPNNVQQLADSIILLLKEENICKEFGTNGFKKYKNNFTWEIVSKKMLDIIKIYI